MRALVTGGSGYFGSLLIDKLLHEGFDVGSLDIIRPDNIPSEVRFHQADIRDQELLNKYLSGYDLIFHNHIHILKKLF